MVEARKMLSIWWTRQSPEYVPKIGSFGGLIFVIRSGLDRSVTSDQGISLIVKGAGVMLQSQHHENLAVATKGSRVGTIRIEFQNEVDGGGK